MFQERRRALHGVAASAAALGVAAGGALVYAPAAGAAPVDYTASCTNKYFPEIPDKTVSVDLQVSPAKPAYQVGDQVSVTWVWKTYPSVPPKSPVAVPADSTLPSGEVVLSGAQSGAPVAVTGERKNPEAQPGADLILTNMTGTFTLTAPGTVNLTPGKYQQSSIVWGIDAVTACQPAAGTTVPVSTSLVVEAPPAPAPTLTSQAEPVLAGGTVALTGTNWPAGTPTATLCAPDGTACDDKRISAATLKVADGNLSGTVTIAPGTPAGSYAVKLTSGQVSLKAAVTVAPTPQQNPVVTLSTTSGPVGSKVKILGSNFPPNGTVTISPLPDGAGVVVPVDPGGNFTHEVTVTQGLTGFKIADGAKQVTLPFTVTPPPGPVDPTALSMTQAGTGIDFGQAVNGQVRQLDAALNRITVVDRREGSLGWSLSATLTDLTAQNGTDKIPAGHVSWTPSCTAAEGATGQVVTGAAGPLGPTAATLCAATPGTAPGTGGTFTADAAMVLTTPEFGAAGTYTGTLTLTLS